jgi:photosystem II stability/assembly factor-like uncharacterized protein
MKSILLLPVLIILVYSSVGQSPMNKDSIYGSKVFSDINFRSLGPAFASGRIADIAVHPEDENVWYIAVGSGGVWKTENAGTTWTPLFDEQSCYSTGCITIDPNNPHVIWVGTGENVGGRHVSYGDGIYRSDDDGKHWKNMGLKESQHISKIIVHPTNPNIVWVAVQGPLWNKGGERGLYKTTDGGENWVSKMENNEWTGVTDLVIDPRNPDVLYAATWQRHRTVAAYMGGGPGSGLHRSLDGGETWEKLNRGLPASNMGKIGLAISPQQPDVLYAAIELDLRKGGVYRSSNRGSNWTKMSDAVSGGTGPHYYQELYASPHAFDRIYLADVRIQVSDDGGANFRRLNEQHKHSDNHAMAFKSDDPDYLMVGSDGGIYESFDLAKNWRFIDNLPLTQYYKVAVDDAEPFYNVYGGTQDVNTHGGPSRTDNVHGIRNGDWYITLFGDGHQPATEPGNPDIMYSEWQQGNLCRIDKTTGEIVYIKPQADENGVHERYNWDAPILVSPHQPTRLYFASQRVWRSDNRGDSWTAISDDLTRNQNRLELPIMGRQQSYDNPWDVYAMSNYNSITSLSESPIVEGLIYAGTDDGLLNITEDGGQSWRKLELANVRGLPTMAFVNDIKADLFDENIAYLVADNHKYGDFNPYVLKTIDRGKTWRSISSNLPERTLVWRIVQDHKNSNLLFVATEFGIYFSVNGGDYWTKFKGGLPTISFRDLAIQRREDDLVGASFGRSFYILDDYSFLREVNDETLAKKASLFNTRDALWYIPRPGVGFSGKGNQGAAYFVAENPPFGAVFTYHLAENFETGKKKRKKEEKELNKNKQNIPFPGWESLEDELNEESPILWVVVKDNDGNTIRRLQGSTSKGFHRIAWDLKYPDYGTVDLGEKFDAKNAGLMAGPGRYTVELILQQAGAFHSLTEPRSFNVVRMREGALPSSEPAVSTNFWREIEDLQQQASAVSKTLDNAFKKVDAMRTALYNSSADVGQGDKEILDIRNKLLNLKHQLSGNEAKSQVGEKNNPTVQERIGFAFTGTSRSTYGPTPSHRQSVELADKQLEDIRSTLNQIVTYDMDSVEKLLKEVGAPWIEGSELPGRKE